MGETRLSRPPMVTPWGKCDEVAKTMIPEEAALVLQARARAAGVPYSEVLRNVLLRSAFGEDMVEEWLIGQFRSTIRSGTGNPEQCHAAFFGLGQGA